MDFVHLDRPSDYEGRVAIIRFDRGNRANALSRALMKELYQAAVELEDDLDLVAVILTGRDDVFTLGADLKEAKEPKQSIAPKQNSMGLGARRVALKLGKRLCAAWERLDMMTLVAMEGWVIGGGVALAVACDLRIAGEGARFYAAEVERGMNMSWGSVPRLVSLCGPAKTKRLIALAERWSAAEASRYGLIDEVVADGGALDRAKGIAQRLLALPPNSVKMIKQDINAYSLALAGLGSHRDADAFALAQSSEDFAEAGKAFLEKRPPQWTGR